MEIKLVKKDGSIWTVDDKSILAECLIKNGASQVEEANEEIINCLVGRTEDDEDIEKNFSITELKKMAKEKKIKGYSKMDSGDLMMALGLY